MHLSQLNRESLTIINRTQTRHQTQPHDDLLEDLVEMAHLRIDRLSRHIIHRPRQLLNRQHLVNLKHLYNHLQQ